jgi:Skp family chaperone for outer membrane proteins
MTLSKRDLLIAAVCLVMAATGLLAYQAGARVAMATPSVVAVVDLTKVIASLNQFGDGKARIEQQQEKLRGDYEKKVAELKAMEAGLKDLTGDAQDQAVDAMRLKQIEMQSWMSLSDRDVETERALLWQAVYREVKATIAQIAEAEGYDLVLVNDSGGEVTYERQSQVPYSQQVMARIAERRTLYAGKTVDITEKLILRMNNAR